MASGEQVVLHRSVKLEEGLGLVIEVALLGLVAHTQVAGVREDLDHDAVDLLLTSVEQVALDHTRVVAVLAEEVLVRIVAVPVHTEAVAAVLVVEVPVHIVAALEDPVLAYSEQQAQVDPVLAYPEQVEVVRPLLGDRVAAEHRDDHEGQDQDVPLSLRQVHRVRLEELEPQVRNLDSAQNS